MLVHPQGEPLNNYNNVIGACRALIDCKRWNLAHGRVTVSTVGVTPKMRNLTRDLPEVSLALSLHAPNQAMRSAIVPAAKNYPIEGLIDALDAHMMAMSTKNGKKGGGKDRIQASKRKRAMLEYVMCKLTFFSGIAALVGVQKTFSFSIYCLSLHHIDSGRRHVLV